MKKQIILAVILVIGGILLFGFIKGPDTVSAKIVISGTEGLKITGKYTADGSEHTIEKVLPTEITIEAGRISLTVETSDGSEGLFAKVYVNDKLQVSGGQQHIDVAISGKTMFSSPKTHLKAY